MLFLVSYLRYPFKVIVEENVIQFHRGRACGYTGYTIYGITELPVQQRLALKFEPFDFKPSALCIYNVQTQGTRNQNNCSVFTQQAS